MQNNFVKTFLNVVGDITVTVGTCFIRESLARKILRIGGINPDLVYRGFYNLEQRGLIKMDKKNIEILPKGLEWYHKSYLKYFWFTDKKWDGKWRIVIFDIPSELNKERNRLRNKLKSFGFFLLQRSVFIYPYACEKELGELCKDIGVADYVDIITGSNAGYREKEIKTFFGLDKPNQK